MATTTTKDILPFRGFTHSVVNFVDLVKPYKPQAFKWFIFLIKSQVLTKLINQATVAELVSQTWHDKDSRC